MIILKNNLLTLSLLANPFKIQRNNSYNDELMLLCLEALIKTQNLEDLMACRQFNSTTIWCFITNNVCIT